MSLNVRSKITRNYYWAWPASVALLFILLGLTYPDLKTFDTGIISLVQSLPRGLKPIMEALSSIASPTGISIVLVLWLVILTVFKRWRYFLTTVASLSTMPLYAGLKLLFHRARPDPHVLVQFGFNSGADSFPSGHAAASCILYLVIAYVLQKELSKKWSRVTSVAAVLLIVSIGISRIYLGYHYPTDVFGGWLVAIFVFLIVKCLADGKIERDSVKT